MRGTSTSRAVMEHVDRHRRDLCAMVVDYRDPQTCGGQDSREVVNAEPLSGLHA